MTEDIHMGDESKTKRTDGALLRDFRIMGDEQAFADLMHRHGQMVHNTARALVGNAMEAEDIAQATFLALARKGKMLEGADSVSGWLYHVTLCLARNAYRGVIRRKAREEEAAMLAAEPDPGLFAEGVVATLYEELGKLAEKYRQPVILHHLEGLDYETAAPMCGCNGKTFSVRLTRGREQLRERMARRGVTLGAAALIAGLSQSAASAAELPAALVVSTCKAATAVAAGGSVAGGGLVSAKVAALTDSALKFLFWGQVKTVAAVCAGIAVLGGTGVTLATLLTHLPQPEARQAAVVVPADMLPVAQVSSGRVNRVGVNISEWGGAGKDYVAEKIWADAMRSHRQWGLPYACDKPVELDANGWPLADASCLVYHGLLTGNNHGTYRLSFDCANPSGVAVAEDWGGGVIQNRSVAGSRVSCDLVIADTNNSQCLLRFTNTRGGVRNVKLMRPTSSGCSLSYAPDKVFTEPLLAAVAPFEVLRYMHWMHSSAPLRDMEWARRTRWDYATQRGVNTPGWGAPGPSWESVIKFANAAGKDAWICLPVRANDDYIRSLALLIRDGSAVCEPLRPDLKLYVEYGNDVWNRAQGQQWDWVTNAVASARLLRFDGEADPVTLVSRFQAMRTVQISDAFRAVFGHAAMRTRIRPVLCQPQDNADLCFRAMSFLDRYYARRDNRSDWSDPHPVSYYLYGLACSTWFKPEGAPPALTLENIWTSAGFVASNHFASLQYAAAMARMYGLAFLSYEGGPHPNYNGDQVVTRLAAMDPRMRAKQLEMQKVFNQVDGELNVLSHLIDKNPASPPREEEGHFGMLRGNIERLDGPRYQAVLDIKAVTPEPVALGAMAPFRRAGGDCDVESRGGLHPARSGAITLVAASDAYTSGYCFRVPRSGRYAVRVEYRVDSPSTMLLEHDGRVAGSFVLESTSGVAAASAPVTVACVAGRLHAIKLSVLSGRVTVHAVSVEDASP
jgi:RNA polymerase sigma factor (sigma-70 family)